ncbi:hypothetical protein V8Q18_05475 [Acinetobacter baumannii]
MSLKQTIESHPLAFINAISITSASIGGSVTHLITDQTNKQIQFQLDIKEKENSSLENKIKDKDIEIYNLNKNIQYYKGQIDTLNTLRNQQENVNIYKEQQYKNNIQESYNNLSKTNAYNNNLYQQNKYLINQNNYLNKTCSIFSKVTQLEQNKAIIENQIARLAESDKANLPRLTRLSSEYDSRIKELEKKLVCNENS